jgi:hypothetical protein
MSTHPFEKEFDRVIANFDQACDDARRLFVDTARINPDDAVRYYAEGAVRKRRLLSALRYARSFLDHVGDEYPTRLAAVLAVTEELRSAVLLDACSSRTTSDFANGVDRAELQGLVDAVRELEVLSRHESIAVG